LHSRYIATGLRRVKSITQNYDETEDLDTKLVKATKITQKLKFDSEQILDISRFPEYPDYLGYYFRKAYHQVFLQNSLIPYRLTKA
jgi:hypothetical protein